METFLNSKGIEFSNRGQSTFNLDTLEKKLQSNITPESSQNNQSDGNNTKDSSDNNQQSPTPNQYQRDVEISSGFEQNTSNDDNNKPDNNNLGFGF